MTLLNRVTALVLTAALAPASAAAQLKPGDSAPPFSLLDQNAEQHKLENYRGAWVVAYFYPKNDTPGCTTQACAFRDDIYVLRSMGVNVIGISMDNVKSHKEFAEKYNLPFPLLSDADGQVARSYGSFSSYGPFKFASRHTFIIDPEGRIAKIYRQVSPKTHSDQVIADLKALGA